MARKSKSSSVPRGLRRTGLDFLAELPDDAENVLEGRKVERAW